MKCSKCQSEISPEMKFCWECGSLLRLDRSEQDMMNLPDGNLSVDPAPELMSTTQDPVCAIHGSRCLLDMILRASTCLTKTMDLDHFLEVVTAELVKSMEVDAAGVLLFDDRLNDFYWRTVRDPKSLLGRRASDREIRIDRRAIDQAFQTGEPVVVAAAVGAPALRMDNGVDTDSFIHDALVVPLNTRDKTIGLIVLANKKTGQFRERDIGVSVSLAGVVAMSIENADFFDELLDSYTRLVGLERMKSKILHRLSHELKTPLAIMKGSIRPMERRLKELGISEFDGALMRLNRQVQNLGRLEFQVESIMKRGYAEQREAISGLLESAASLIELQAEQMPEIKCVASLLLRTLEDAFPANQEQWRKIDIKEFGQCVLEYVRGEAAQQGRRLNLKFDLDDGAEVLIPDLVLHATIEGLVRNAIEATPDSGVVSVRGRSNGDSYVFNVEDSGIGIPEEDWGLVFEGFYQVQETENYTSGRPYSFKAGGKGMDLFRIKMFSKIYGFGLYFRSRRCERLIESLRECPGSVDRCPYCNSVQDCMDRGGTVFEVELPLAR